MTNTFSLGSFVLLAFIAISCTRPGNTTIEYEGPAVAVHHFAEGVIDSEVLTGYIKGPQSVKNSLPDSIVLFAKTLIGTPYKFGCEAPETGFDCSGFITYVFNHFNISVPRSSIGFTDVGEVVPKDRARPGDIILFTGTNSSIRTVGHVGIVVTNDQGKINFIQSTSGKEFSVTITPLDGDYLVRFVKVIRIIR